MPLYKRNVFFLSWIAADVHVIIHFIGEKNSDRQCTLFFVPLIFRQIIQILFHFFSAQ